jgi:ribonuclease HII
MQNLDEAFPGYGFALHKGYCTQQHVQAIRRLGPCPLHRRSFAPIKDLFEQE